MLKPYPLEENIIKVPRFEESAGFYTTKQRSKIMSKIKSKNSKPEILLRKALWAKNLRFRLHLKGLPGRPDIIIQKYRLVIFVDGDFWHGYNWLNNPPKFNKNAAFWIPKIERNLQRDQYVTQTLTHLGYTVMRFWEHEVKQNLQACINQVLLYVEAEKLGRVLSKE